MTGQRAVGDLLAPWTGPYDGLPPFDKVEPELFAPAYEEAIASKRAEIDAIATDPAAPTFENTIAALEDCGRPLQRLDCLFDVFATTMNVGPMREAHGSVSQMIAAFDDEIVQNAALFARVSTVHASAQAGLSPEQRRLTSVVHDRMVRRGAALGGQARTRLAAINTRLAGLYATFRQNLMADEASQVVLLETEADLAGLPDDLRAAVAAEARSRGREGCGAVANTGSAVNPFLSYSSRRDLRERVWRMSVNRGGAAGANPNDGAVAEILRLRAEKADLLGFASYAAWATAEQMAKTPEAPLELMHAAWRVVAARATEEIADMQRLALGDGVGDTLAPWDHLYYGRLLREGLDGLDDAEIKPYLQLENLRKAVFWAAGEAHGLTFEEVAGAPVCHPDVRVFAVGQGGRPLGLWWFDPFARAGKKSGGWMSEYRSQERFRDAVLPQVSNNTNFVAGTPGEPVLISWEDAQTLFHEFGHALHGLCSRASYPTLAGVKVAHDFVELPSQLNEYWLTTDEVLGRFAVHHQTGEAMPSDLVGRIRRAKTFEPALHTLQYLASAIYDMKVHLLPAGQTIDADLFESAVMTEIGMPPGLVMRQRPTQFAHVFGGDYYAAGYYAYLWADALVADAAEAFAASPGGFYDRATAKRFHDRVLSVGNTVAADQAFRDFQGRDVDLAPLMRRLGAQSLKG